MPAYPHPLPDSPPMVIPLLDPNHAPERGLNGRRSELERHYDAR